MADDNYVVVRVLILEMVYVVSVVVLVYYYSFDLVLVVEKLTVIVVALRPVPFDTQSYVPLDHGVLNTLARLVLHLEILRCHNWESFATMLRTATMMDLFQFQLLHVLVSMVNYQVSMVRDMFVWILRNIYYLMMHQ